MAILALAGLILMPVSVLAVELSGHKDDLFALPKTLTRSADGAFEIVDYQEMRDINGRDEIPERRAKRQYVDLSVRKQARMAVFQYADRRIEIGAAGRFEGARFAVIFVHGRGGDRRLGMNDYTFGGNFNRIMNLAVKNHGVYVAPTIADFGAPGLADIKALIDGIAEMSPDAPVVLACGSMGSLVCLQAAQDAKVVARLAGMVMLGAVPDAGLARSALVKKRVPVIFVHGSNDSVYSWEEQRAVFDAIRKSGKNYPARFVLLNTGSHGSPIRMVDWKQVLQTVLARF